MQGNMHEAAQCVSLGASAKLYDAVSIHARDVPRALNENSGTTGYRMTLLTLVRHPVARRANTLNSLFELFSEVHVVVTVRAGHFQKRNGYSLYMQTKLNTLASPAVGAPEQTVFLTIRVLHTRTL